MGSRGCIIDLATYRRGSDTRLYLLAVPIGAVILIGVREGIFAALLTYPTLHT